MAWFDNGLQGDISIPASSGISQPAYAEHGYGEYNCANPNLVSRISLDTQRSTYRRVLATFSMGTQIYMDCYTEPWTYWAYLPTGIQVNGLMHSANIYIKDPAGNVTLLNAASQLDGYLTENWIYQNLNFSIYGKNYAYTGGKPETNPQFAFPFDGQGGGTNIGLIAVPRSDGILFYIAGFSSYVEYGTDRYYFNCPVRSLFLLPTSILNDPKYFDSVNDAYTPEPDQDGGGEGGNIPKLPVAPTYPGDDMGHSPLPTGGSAVGFGRLNIYKASNTQLNNALDILYSDTSESTIELILESIKKWLYKPDQYCITLMLSPVDAATNVSKNIKFGKYDSGVQAPCVTSQWHTIDCGTISVPLKYGSFLDFEPHSKVKLFLPFVGFRTLNANEVIGGTLSIKYNMDILTGCAVCEVLVTREGSNTAQLYNFDCNLCVQIPLTSMSYNTVVQSLLSAGVAGITLGVGVSTGGIAGAGAIFAGASSGLNSVVNAASNQLSPELTQSGAFNGSAGVLGYNKPFLLFQTPIPTTPSNYVSEKGKPSNIYMPIGQCSGYTVISNLHVDIPGITDREVDMIKDAFKKGVYC